MIVQAHVRQRSPIAFRDLPVFSILFETVQEIRKITQIYKCIDACAGLSGVS